MAKFEYKVSHVGNIENIEAADYDLDMKNGKLTFTDEDQDQIASFSVKDGAYVRRLSK